MVNNDSKRYRVELHTWGKNWNGKDYFKTDITKFDDIKEVEDFVKLIDEIYSGITRPDVNESYKYRKKAPKYCKSNEDNYIYDENHFWWGYAVLDYKNEKVIMQGGVGLYDFWNPMKSLVILDRYFGKEGEVPKDYVWDINEYEGWLRFRWGDGENAIDKVKARKAKEDELKKKAKKKAKKEKQEDWADFEYDEEYDMYRFKED